MIPLIKARPPRLSESPERLRALEDSGIFSNFGPVNTQFEQDLTARMFGGTGTCLTVCNATLGLMLAIRAATERRSSRQVCALMPAFTFAATAHAADWCGLKPLFCDIDPHNWALDPECLERLIQRYRGDIAVIVPYATFGYDIDLGYYASLQSRHGIPVVVDAAASLGTLATDGEGFGTGFTGAVVFSMHATKSFSTGEGGVIYSADAGLIAKLRTMTNFGFGEPRTATMPGLNAKLSELCALMAHLRLQDYAEVVANRGLLMQRYRRNLPGLVFQSDSSRRQAHQFTPVLLPSGLIGQRAAIQAQLKQAGVGVANYFSPHLAEQPFFAAAAGAGNLPVTDQIAARILSLPLFDGMSIGEVDDVCTCLMTIIGRSDRPESAGRHYRPVPAIAAATKPAEIWRAASGFAD